MLEVGRSVACEKRWEITTQTFRRIPSGAAVLNMSSDMSGRCCPSKQTRSFGLDAPARILHNYTCSTAVTLNCGEDFSVWSKSRAISLRLKGAACPAAQLMEIVINTRGCLNMCSHCRHCCYSQVFAWFAPS